MIKFKPMKTKLTKEELQEYEQLDAWCMVLLKYFDTLDTESENS